MSPAILEPLIAKIFNKKKADTVPHRIYGTVVASARNSDLFTDFQIPDSVMGRYNMLALHMFLLTNRFKYVEASNKDDAASVSQEVFDLFLLDIERGLRDIGFADTSTHKRKKKLARSYYALIEEFDSPLQTSDHPALFSAVGARYFDKLEDGDVSKAAENLGQYMIDTHRVLASQSDTDIISGSFHWQEEEKK